MDLTKLLYQSQALYNRKQIHEALELLEYGLIHNSNPKNIPPIQKLLTHYYNSLRSDPLCSLKLNTNQYSQKQLKKQFHILILKYHPDKYKGSSEIFKIVKENYEKLRNTCKKQLHTMILTCLERTTCSIKLSWSFPISPTEYELYFKPAEDKHWKLAKNKLMLNTCQKYNLKSNTEYNIKIKYLNLKKYTNTLTVKTLNSIPPKLRIFTKSLGSSNQIKVSWKPITDATSYHLQVNNITQNSIRTFITTKSSYMISSNCQEYLVLRVRAKNKIGYGYWSTLCKLNKPVRYNLIPERQKQQRYLLSVFTTYSN